MRDKTSYFVFVSLSLFFFIRLGMFACLGLMLDLFHCPFGAAVSLLLTVLGKDIYCGEILVWRVKLILYWVAVFFNDLFDIRCMVSDFKMLTFLIRVNIKKIGFVGKVNSINVKNRLNGADTI